MTVAWMLSLASWTSLQQHAVAVVEAVAHKAAAVADHMNLNHTVRFQEDSLPHNSTAHEAVDTAAAAAVQALVLGTAHSGNPGADSHHPAAYYY